MSVMLILSVAPSLEDSLVDYLLTCPAVDGFTSLEARGHGERGTLTLAEQVSGRRRRLQFELRVEAAAVDIIVAGLAESVGIDIAWWVLPIVQSGHV